MNFTAAFTALIIIVPCLLEAQTTLPSVESQLVVTVAPGGVRFNLSGSGAREEIVLDRHQLKQLIDALQSISAGLADNAAANRCAKPRFTGACEFRDTSFPAVPEFYCEADSAGLLLIANHKYRFPGQHPKALSRIIDSLLPVQSH